jgi:thymidylate synthase
MEASSSQNQSGTLGLLIITQGQWGERIAETVTRHAPPHWTTETWKAPPRLPQIIDDPEDFLPPELPQADLVLSLGSTPGVAQLLPDIAQMSGAQAVLAPIDHNAALPPGLVGQLRGWLETIGVASVFPKPFCSLTATTINRSPIKSTYKNPLVQEFVQYFGKPEFEIESQDQIITSVRVIRDAACGCGASIAENLPGTTLADAGEKAGMLHHHFPCLAEMQQDSDYHDTLMHVSGNFHIEAIKDALKDQINPTPYIKPHGFIDTQSSHDQKEET